ncbi:MurR/RpiR family transcriptional regulator [Exiguobacterium aurantiacum]|uniref:MurR/RpiR family transcriptional regulator n=1 Tax=Exiguobacterium aurantiacum TaxID=33987 RepID=UPI0008776551|nr:MurR/RpiR family transcriptional regulator [Exiguobacterium aurantiacum]
MEPSVWDLLKGKNRLTEMEYSVLLFAAENVSLVREMNIRELAARCYTSPATIIRLCKKLGFKGYSEFLFFLKGQQPTLHQTQTTHFEAWDDQFKMFLTNFERTNTLISEQTLAFHRLLDESRSIFLYGAGFSTFFAEYMAKKLHLLKKQAWVSSAGDSRSLFLAHIEHQDLFIAFSRSGETESVLEKAQIAKQHDIPVIAFTRATKNRLGDLASVHIPIYDDQREESKAASSYDSNLLLVMEMLLHR